jgi:hypothetical protein
MEIGSGSPSGLHFNETKKLFISFETLLNISLAKKEL